MASEKASRRAKRLPPRLPPIDRLNALHAVVREAGKTIVITDEFDPVLNRRVLTRSSFADFRNYYMNEMVQIKNGTQITVKALGDYWLHHPDRRQYFGIVFQPRQETPGFFNLWRGFAVDPQKGDWSLMRDHIRDTLCSGDENLFRYVVGWCAAAVQSPCEPAEVAMVFRGRRGTGKGIFCRQLGAIFGQHFIQVANPRHLVGNFNAHLQDAILVFADEAFGAGDKRAEAVLKMLITEPTIPIERKHRDVTVAKNMTHLLVASNEDWVVPAGLDERRFVVLDAAEDHAQDRPYFARLVEQMNNGGRAAMLHDLLTFDLSTVNLRDPPTTAALHEQKIFSMQPHEQWWYEKLQDGRLLSSHDKWEREVLRDELQADFAISLGRPGHDRSVATQLGQRLAKLLPGGFPGSVQRSLSTADQSNGRRRRHWTFPNLADCRAHFDKLTRMGHPWPNDDEETNP